MISIFEKIKTDEQKIKDSITSRNRQIRELETRDTITKKRYYDLKKKAKEFEGLFQDHRHPCLIDFMQKIKEEFMRDLRIVNLKSKNIQETALMSARISAKMELLDRLEYEPLSIVKQFRNKKRLE